MKGKVKSVRVVTVGIAQSQYGNIETLVENPFRVAQREMPSPKNYEVYAYLKSPSQKGGDDFEARGTKFTNKATKDMLVQIVSRASELLQSDQEVLLKDFHITFNFIEIPEGGSGTATVSRDKLSILNKKSVNRITNNDNTCFWYALDANFRYTPSNQTDKAGAERQRETCCRIMRTMWYGME